MLYKKDPFSVYPVCHRIKYTWHEPKRRSSIAFAREKHFFFKMFLTIYHMSRISVLLSSLLRLSSMALNFVVLCLWCVLIQNSLWSNTFQKSPSFCTVDFQAECIVHLRISKRANGHSEMGFTKKWHDLKIEVQPYPITKRVLSRRSFDSWAIKRWWTSWRPHWVVSHHLLRERSWSHHFLNCHVLHKLQMTIK